MNPTPEQSAILAAAAGAKSNLMLNALAGCGKTSTLEMIEKAVDVRPILYLVFNKKNAEEAEERMLSTTTVRTFNSLGHRIWAKACAKAQLKLDPRKTQTILKGLIDEQKSKETRNEFWSVYWEVTQGVALAKALGYIPEGKFPNAKRLTGQSAFHSRLDEAPDDLTSDLIDACLCRSIAAAYDGNIDYNDQIYMPALFGGTYPRFPLVFVDEAQDLNPTNHAMLAHLCKSGSRLIAVGDPNQAIYGFRGAVPSGMEAIAAAYAVQPLDLSVSFRCPKAIVEHVHWRVPNFKWIKDGGTVETPDDLSGLGIADASAVISRNNAPLFRLAMRLLSVGRSVSVAGSDIGPKLLGILRKLGPEELSRSATLSAIADWQAEREAKDSTTAKDMAECMRVFVEHGQTLGQAIAYAEHLFAQKGSIRLMTGHKSKGLEFDCVYHLDPWLCGESDQDQNLRYVISTRSMNRLVEIDSMRIKW